ncbi:MAG: Lhr-like helicase [Roseivirga sp.]|jgi:Lhr-like helicase
MDKHRNLGIWMDHSIANLIEFKDSMTCHSIESDFTKNEELDAMQKSENLMHNKKQQMHEAYYKEIADEILNYDQVLLFGPTNARVELFNYLKKDLHFKDIKFDLEAADKMTDNEQFAFVRKHFEN